MCTSELFRVNLCARALAKFGLARRESREEIHVIAISTANTVMIEDEAPVAFNHHVCPIRQLAEPSTPLRL